MEVYNFTEMPYTEFPESEAEKFPSMRLTFPNAYFDPHLAGELFRRDLDEYQYVEGVGFDGLTINEHHNTPSCKDRLGIGALLLEAQAGQMSHQTTMRSIELLGREVIPALKEL